MHDCMVTGQIKLTRWKEYAKFNSVQFPKNFSSGPVLMYNSYDILSIKKAKSILCNFKMWQYVSSFIKWNCTKRFLGCGVGLEYYTKIIKLAHAISHPRTHTHNVFLWFFLWEFATRWCFCKPPFYRSRHQGFQLEQLWVKDRKSIKKNSVPCKLKYMYIFSSWQKKSLKSCCKNF